MCSPLMSNNNDKVSIVVATRISSKTYRPTDSSDFIGSLFAQRLGSKNQLWNSDSFWDIYVSKASLGIPEHTWPHLPKLTWSIYNFNMKLHAQYQLYTSFSSWDLKVLITSLGMPDPTHVKLRYQFVALIDMFLHTKNKLYTSNSFCEI